MSEERRFLSIGKHKLDTSTGKIVPDTAINRAFSNDSRQEHTSSRSYDGGNRRYIDDLPLPAPQSKAVAIIAAYHIFGLSTADIAHVVGTSVNNVEHVIDTKEFGTFVELMLANIREHDTDKVRKKINKAAENAAEKIVNLSDSKDEKVSLAASKDILDRAANGSYAAGGGRADKSNHLVIRIIDDRDNPSDNIDVEL